MILFHLYQYINYRKVPVLIIGILSVEKVEGRAGLLRGESMESRLA